MKKIFSGCLLISVMFLAASAVAADMSRSGCTLQGSWMGTNIVLLTTYSGQSVNSGTIIEELPGFDPTLGGTYPTAIKLTNLRGVWERTGGNTFVYTQIGYAIDAGGNIVWTGKNSGNKTLTEDCNLMTIESTLEVISPNVTSSVCMQVPTLYLKRISVDPACKIDL